MEKGIIVLMNGTSSAGKTSISIELMNQKEILFHHLSIDDFLISYNEFIDNKFSNIQPIREIDDQTVANILFDPIISVYYSTIKLFSELGLNVIVDTVIDNDRWFNMCLDLFNDSPTLFIGVKCSREELKRREQMREDRVNGLANSQYDKVYCFNKYDLEVNTEEMNSTECARKILRYIESGNEFSAFKELDKRIVSIS